MSAVVASKVALLSPFVTTKRKAFRTEMFGIYAIDATHHELQTS